MTEPNRADLSPHPHVSQEPIRTGNPPETLADREDVVFGPPTDMEGRMSGGWLALIVVGVLVVVGVVVVAMLPGVVGW